MTKLEKMKQELSEKAALSWNKEEYNWLVYDSFKAGFDASTAYHAEIIQELVKALEFYVDRDTWKNYGTNALEDSGDVARQALESVRLKI